MTFLLALLLATGPAPDTPRLAAAPATDIRVDGDLSESDWEAAEVASDFVQFEPVEGAPASQRTRVRVLVSGDALYIGAEMDDDSPEAIRQTLSRRDDTGGADHIAVYVDGYNDGLTARVFGVTAAGVQFDGITEGSSTDESWDAVWTSAVRVTPTGWTAEFRIPFSQLRFTGEEATWGINFLRVIPRTGEEAYWSPIPREQADSGIVQFFGDLEGIAGVRPRRLVQAVPYTLAGARRYENPGVPGDPVYDDRFDAGADFKVGITPSVILDATVNPDFGQVEADPAELNLSTFETFFEERRPFFLEGTQIFDNGFSRDGALVYTRRIGARAPILAASKVTGRTSGGLSFGALAAASGRDETPGEWYGVARVKQELGSQNYVGLTATGYDETNAGICGGGVCRQSAVGAVDWQYRVGPNEEYQAEGVLAGSARREPGGTARGLALYAGFDQVKGFQRFGSGFRVFMPGFRNDDVGRFRETDLVRVNGAYITDWNSARPFGPFRRLSSFLSGTTTWTYSDRTFRGGEISLSASGQLRDFQRVSLSTGLYGIGGNDVRETRGLGPVANLLQVSGSAGISTDTRRQFVASADLGYRFDAEGGRGFGPEVGVEWAVSDRFQFEVSGEMEVARGFRAWAANEGLVRSPSGELFVGAEAAAPADLLADDLVGLDLGPAAVDGLLAGAVPVAGPVPALADGVGYYLPLFGARDYTSADVLARANLILRPTLSFQFYGQLFAARGRYQDFQLLTAPDTFRPLDAYPKRRDFSVASFRTNAVMRWEYRPGSALFVVWQRATGDDLFEEVLLTDAGESPFDRGTPALVDDLFATFADDVVLVKLSYLLSR